MRPPIFFRARDLNAERDENQLSAKSSTPLFSLLCLLLSFRGYWQPTLLLV